MAGNRCATTGCRFHGARTATPSPRIISGRRWRGARGRPWEGHIAAGPNPGSREARGSSPPREGRSRPSRLGPGSRGGARRSPATGCSSRQTPIFRGPGLVALKAVARRHRPSARERGMSSSTHHPLPRRQPPRVLPRRGGQRGRRPQKRRRPHLGPPSGPRPHPIPKWDMWTDARTALLTSSAITYRRGKTAGTGRPWNGAERELALAQCPSRIPGAETIPKESFRNCGVPHIPRPAGPGVSTRRGVSVSFDNRRIRLFNSSNPRGHCDATTATPNNAHPTTAQTSRDDLFLSGESRDPRLRGCQDRTSERAASHARSAMLLASRPLATRSSPANPLPPSVPHRSIVGSIAGWP